MSIDQSTRVQVTWKVGSQEFESQEDNILMERKRSRAYVSKNIIKVGRTRVTWRMVPTGMSYRIGVRLSNHLLSLA